MKGVSKPFSRKLHATNDPKSRELIKTFFAERGVKLVDHPNKFHVDLTSEDGLILVEVEHRLNWKTPDFPYDEINVPERKGKFFIEGNTHYIILSKDFKRLGFITANIIQKYIKPKFLKESSNRFVAEKEYFYKVPRKKFEFFDL